VTVIRVQVKPRARRSLLEQADDGTFRASLRSAPVDGAANAELIELVARRFGCSKSAVTIKSGTSSRTKLVAIALD
jgi:uncharacterized protein YggU (UPF0235/DUF167 family)